MIFYSYSHNSSKYENSHFFSVLLLSSIAFSCPMALTLNQCIELTDDILIFLLLLDKNILTINIRYQPWNSLEGLMLKLKFNTLATWWKEQTLWRRPWCWERLRARGEGDDRGWDGWMSSLIQWTWVWANSGKPSMLQSMGSQRVRLNLVTEHHHHHPVNAASHYLYHPPFKAFSDTGCKIVVLLIKLSV